MSRRYDRQIILPEIGPVGQSRLAAASVLCIGAGGLGAPALLYLAAAGIGHIGVIDFDCVDETNLQRQVLFNIEDIGHPKAEAAATRLRALNPEIRIQAHTVRLSPDNAESLCAPYDIILDGTDNFAAKFLINDCAVKLGKPLVYGAIQGFEGQVSVFDPARGGPCYRCLYPAPPKATIQNCAQAGVIGAVAGIVGVTQALQVIQLIVAHPDFQPLVGRLFLIDTRTMATRTLNLSKSQECPVCAIPREQINLKGIKQLEPFSCAHLREITPDSLHTIPDAVFVDVRELHEWEAGHFKGHLHHALSRLQNGELPDLPVDRPLIILCAHGHRSQIAAHLLIQRGLTNVYSLKGGYVALRDFTGDPDL